MLRHKQLVDVDGRNAQRSHQAVASRRSQDYQSGGGYQMRSNDEDATNDEDTDELEDRWRQAAQMLTDDDEIQLFAGLNNNTTESHRALSGRKHAHFARLDSASPSKGTTTTTTTEQDDDDDDNSSISFAQSGCHSILSAWRIKAANRASRASRRPTSVLSNASSAGRKSAASTQYTSRGKSPASQTRIPLGPKAAQHFVTNTRRRRQANELILSTLEARRRVLALNRQNASLLGSASYLADPFDRPNSRNENEPLLQAAVAPDDYSAAGVRLSLSPSPATKSPSPAPRRPPLSDLGGRSSVAAQAQRHRLLLNANARAKLEQQVARPPLARLDQNSSDLYSTNSSSSGSSSESSGSKFTQLVTSELAPDCILLDEHALKPRLLASQASARSSGSLRSSPKPALPPKMQSTPPKVPERSTRSRNNSNTKSPARATPGGSTRVPGQVNDVEEYEEEEEGPGGKLLRGALRRDSIRRLRLNRSSMRQTANSSGSSTDAAPSSSDSSSSNAASASAKQQTQALSKARKLDIENNPFLNRHHFRTTSARSTTGPGDESPRRRLEANQEEAGPPASTKSNKRSSWLFGLSSQRSADTEVKPPPRVFSEARRSSSSEHIRELGRPAIDSSRSKKSKQQLEEEAAEIKRVERMLRQMRPNQVFTSYAREMSNESSGMTSQSVESHNEQQPTLSVSRQHQLPTSGRLATAAAPPISKRPILPPATVPIGVESVDGRATSGTMGQTRRNNADLLVRPSGSESSSRQFVRESSKSQDDLKFDLAGNKRELKLEERWRHERTSAPNREMERLTSHKTEVIRSSRISPPPGFADSLIEQSSEDTQNSRNQLSSISAASVGGSARRSSSEVRPAVAARRRPVESPPPVPVAPQRSSVSPRAQKPQPPAQTPPRTEPEGAKANEARASFALPKFERTADDEFRKRVDYLRKLARANISSEGPSTTAAPANQERRPAPMTKPMSTNWRQSASMDDSRKDSVSPQLGPIEARTRWNYSPEKTTAPCPKPAATNLDALLASAGYQEREPETAGFKWRRSNSSLAPVSQPSAVVKRVEEPEKPMRENREQAHTISGPPEQEPSRQLTSSALVKLVVKEKSAPKLDYAFVEQRRAAQGERTTTQPPPTRNMAAIQQQPAQVTRAAVQQSAQGSNNAGGRVRSLLRVASPRSPDFGTMAASSNDDSAIASSVSSPSLSFMMNPSNGHETQSQVSRSQPLVGIRSTRPADGPPGALQSILRSQQQQQLLQLSESPEISSQLSAEPPISAVNMKRVHGASISSTQSRESPFRADSRSPEPTNRTAASPVGGAPLVTAATVTSAIQQQQPPTSSPPKRVHFNDRTSIRSFESVSSLASNSTAVPNEILRQQVGSPDSMGSGSTSRLSAESPDFKRGSGAAIYAVRGDPELELEAPHQTEPTNVLQQQQYLPINSQSSGQFAPPYPGALQQQQQFDHQLQHRHPQPFIRMTAPPKITTAAGSPQLQQYLAQPNPLPGTHVIVPKAVAHQQRDLDDDDDPDYALRLRQAATSRVFSYVPGAKQPQQHQHQQQQLLQHSPRHPPMHLARASSSPGVSQLQHQAQRHNQQQRQAPTNRPTLDDLLNFQTEV